jgi:predicted ATPase
MSYTLNPHLMRIGWQSSAAAGLALSSLGDNLANVIFRLKNADEMRYRQLIEHVRILEPDLEAINFTPTPDQVVPYVAMRGRGQASWIGLSDGTIRLLALAYLIEVGGLYPNRLIPVPALQLVEEPENGMAPAVLGKVFDLFEERAPLGQFILTSHSPYVIDRFDSHRDCVTLLRRKEERTEVVSPPPLTPEDQAPDRLTLADQYAAELLE